MTDKKYFAVKMLMGAIQYAAGQLVQLDSKFKQKLEGVNTIIQWKVDPEGPNGYTVVKDSKIEGKMDAVHEKPNYVITLKDLDVALDLFQGKISASDALQQGKIKIEGDAQAAMKQMFILEDLAEYLVDLRG